MSFKKLILILIFGILAIATLFLFADKIGFLKSDNTNSQSPIPSFPVSSDIKSSPSTSAKPTKISTPSPTTKPSLPPASSILLSVPFVAQAPYGEWSISLFQNACEETSILLAWYWTQDQTSINKDQAKQEIIAITEYEYKNYGEVIDLSAADTANLMKNYFNYQNVEVRSGINTQDIKNELLKGNLIIVPVNGQILDNPFYTPPGPAEHMVPIIGYDGVKNEFVANDVGTRHGEKFRYSEANLQAALRDYPTGNHVQIDSLTRAMIIVKPK